ncbi:MAG TPA: plastocyanin/azurin family copper-binding protein [Solirubrobacteraceae bacterium]|jgi:plastocyanin
MSRKALCLSAAAVAAAAVTAIPTGAFGGASARTAGSHTVVLKNVRFHPSTLSIGRGESVKWVWEDASTEHNSSEHNVTFHGFHSRTMTRGSYTVRFTQRGTFNYSCTIHASEGMKGKVVVH